MYNNTIQMQLMKAPRISSGYDRTMLILINLLTRSAACLERISNRYERTIRSPKLPLLLKPGLVSSFSLRPQAVLLASWTVVRLRSRTCFPSKLPPAARCITAVLSLRHGTSANLSSTSYKNVTYQIIRSPGFFHSTLIVFSGLVAQPIKLHINCQLSISDSPSI